jgi:hypothetical protein
MSIYFQYGSYAHDPGECQVAIERTVKHSDNGSRVGYVDRYTVSGVMNVDSATDMNSKIAAIQNAYAQDGKDFGLYDSSAGRLNPFARANQAAVRVVNGPSFPEGGGAEAVTVRTYSVVIEAEYGVTVTGTAATTVRFREAITVSGGGPRKIYIELLNGPPQMQIPVAQTVCYIVHEGEALGQLTWPSPPPPILPGLLSENPTIRRGSPESWKGNHRENYPISWQYKFAAGAFLPNLYPHVQ